MGRYENFVSKGGRRGRVPHKLHIKFLNFSFKILAFLLAFLHINPKVRHQRKPSSKHIKRHRRSKLAVLNDCLVRGDNEDHKKNR